MKSLRHWVSVVRSPASFDSLRKRMDGAVEMSECTSVRVIMPQSTEERSSSSPWVSTLLISRS